ncbi:MAG: OmpA family protein [Bacteroidales bacterium]|nr:OmpA family protein [Bacteroidales bacterium]
MKRELKRALKSIREGDKQYYEAENLRTFRDQRDQDSNYGRQMYLYALEEYLQAFAFNPANAELNFKIAVCYLNTIEKTKSVPYFERALELDPNVSKDIRYLLAQAYHLNYEFEKAINMYNAYRTSLSRLELTREGWTKILDKKIAQCVNGIELMENPVNVEIEKLSNVINTVLPDYNPIVNADETILIFTSRRGAEWEIKQKIDTFNFNEDIYISYNVNGEWTTPVNPGEPLNSDLHESAVGLAPDGQKIFIYRGEEGGDIYESVLQGSNWTEPTKIPAPLNSEFYEGSASFSPDGRTVYFISERPGGRGGSDIFVATKNRRGEWGRATNLGRAINTDLDERGVFMHPDGMTLYFSSEGHNSMGGYDIFKTQKKGRRGWMPPENLGYPINTPENDMFFTVTANGRHGYFSSSKEGTHNIYKIIFKDAVNLLTLVKGFILDEETREPIYAEIDIVDLSTNEDIANFYSNTTTGSYLVSLPSGVNYGISVKADGYLFHSENFNIDSTSEFKEVNKDIFLKRIKVGSVVVLNNIFFDFAKATLRPESTNELDRIVNLLTENPSISVEISGHTDNIGSSAFNKRLSGERAKSVVDYLIGKGIDASRLTSIGYGFDNPIATNETEEGRQINRRTEFKIVSSR